ncbi:MAG: hypothetical protein IJV67_08485 [Clostridia bacterium]|nr:hypothetical protein [Clostridia bacterium]MBQ9710642.1 hypothetical protein [Clostridia bacterium]
MNEIKYRCAKCGALEAVYTEGSADPFGTKEARFVCRKCGSEYGADSAIGAINNKTVNTFPDPSLDLDTDDALTSRIKSKRKTD